MTGDPYEEAADQPLTAGEAKLVPPTPAKKSRKVVLAVLMLTGLILALVVLTNIAGLVTNRTASEQRPLPKPTTMTRQQSESFAQQQSGEAAYIRGQDRDKRVQSAEDTVLGEANGLAGDPYAEADGVPKKTQAQDAAEHKGSTPQSTGKSEAEQLRERALLERQHRRQNDLDSSPVALDFSDYFEKEKHATTAANPANPVQTADAAAPGSEPAPAQVAPVESEPAQLRRSGMREALRDDPGAEPQQASRKQPHDPQDDYTFDSSFGRLYRVMEDTIMETVLVNRLTAASVGPVIVMVTTDVYSENGAHLLISEGTRLLGRVSAVGSVNQERLFVAFHRMIMPDGYSVSLDKFQGLDVVGQTGLRDLVNRHYVQIFGASLALAAISATAQIGNNSAYGAYDWGTEMRSGISEGLGQSAQRVMERFLNILPTFAIRERTRVKVMLAGDLLLPDVKNHTMDPDL